MRHSFLHYFYHNQLHLIEKHNESEVGCYFNSAKELRYCTSTGSILRYCTSTGSIK